MLINNNLRNSDNLGKATEEITPEKFYNNMDKYIIKKSMRTVKGWDIKLFKKIFIPYDYK